jgi:formiminotetrahydrofolate cyclodeaminase
MDEKQPVAQEESYPIREEENEKIQDMLQDGIESDRRVFAVIRERLPKICRQLVNRRRADLGPAGA